MIKPTWTKQERLLVEVQIAAGSIYDWSVGARAARKGKERDSYINMIPDDAERLLKALRKLFKNVPTL